MLIKDQKCCICGISENNGTDRIQRINGKCYCKKHYLQIYRYGHILNRTIYDPNEYIKYDTYFECICYKKDGTESGRVKIDNT